MNIFDKIETVHAATEGWCSWTKGQTLASIVLATRPEISLEIGVFYGKSLLPVAMAHQFTGRGTVYAIDPWMAEASIAGQINPLDAAYWNRQEMHQVAYDAFKTSVYELGLQNVVHIERKTSDDFTPPDNIGLLSVDGNHGEQAVKDVERYAPKVKKGGFLVADDIEWTGGAVGKAIALLPAMGFVELFRVKNEHESWAVFQRL